MDESSEILAWSKLPEPGGTQYMENDLASENSVKVLFDHCQSQDAMILAKGWAYLFQEYGLVGLMHIDAKSGWMQQKDLGDWISEIVHQALVSGYHPIIDAFGDFDTLDSLFLLNDGNKLKVDWKEIYELKNELNV